MSTIVAQVVEQLTDAITELTSIVLERKKQNSTVPPALPQLVDAVCNSANSLIKVANHLVQHEYSQEFPDIAQDILTATKNVTTSVQGLQNATNELVRATDRAAGWGKLSDSCSIIAKMTVQLLEIVYGAEVRKAFAVASKAKNALRDALDASDDLERDGEGQRFADNISNASGDLNTLGNLMSDTAQIQQAPSAKKKYNELGAQLHSGSQGLVDKANALLKNPKDPKTHKALEAELDRLNNLLDNSTKNLRDDPRAADPRRAERSAKEMENLMKALPGLAQKVKSNPNDPKARKDLNDLLDRLEDLMTQIGDTAGSNNPQVEQVKKRAAAALAKMRPGKGVGAWQNTLLDAAKDLNSQLAALLEAAKLGEKSGSGSGASGASNSQTSSNPNIAHTAVVGAMGDVARSLEQATKHSKLTQRNPNDPVVKSYEALGSSFAALAEAAKKGDGSVMIAMAKQIAEEVKQLRNQVNTIAQTCRNPSEQEKLYNQGIALNNFGTQLKILAAVKASSSKGDMGNDQHLVSITKNMGTVLEQMLTTVSAAKLQS